MGTHFHKVGLQIVGGLLRILLVEGIHAGHHGTSCRHVYLIPTPTFVVHRFQATVRQLLDRVGYRLIVADCPALNLHNSRIQRPPIGSRRRQHRPASVHQKPHRPRKVAHGLLRLLVYCPSILNAHQRVRLRDMGKVDKVGVILLIPRHYIVQQLFELLFADTCGFAYCFLDLLQVNAMRPQRLDVLHRDLVQLVRSLEPGAYLHQQGIFQPTIQFSQFLRQSVQQFGRKVVPSHSITFWCSVTTSCIFGSAAFAVASSSLKYFALNSQSFMIPAFSSCKSRANSLHLVS